MRPLTIGISASASDVLILVSLESILPLQVLTISEPGDERLRPGTDLRLPAVSRNLLLRAFSFDNHVCTVSTEPKPLKSAVPDVERFEAGGVTNAAAIIVIVCTKLEIPGLKCSHCKLDEGSPRISVSVLAECLTKHGKSSTGTRLLKANDNSLLHTNHEQPWPSTPGCRAGTRIHSARPILVFGAEM